MPEIIRLQIHTAAAVIFAVWPAVSTGLRTPSRYSTTLKTASVEKGSPLKSLNKNQTKKKINKSKLYLKNENKKSKEDSSAPALLTSKMPNYKQS